MLTNIINKIREKRGGSTIFEVVVCIGLLTFILFYPVATFALTHKENLLEDTLTTGLQMVAVEGGLTQNIETIIYKNMEGKGLLPTDCSDEDKSKVKINAGLYNKQNNTVSSIKGDMRSGEPGNTIYRDDSQNIIYLEIWYPADNEVSFINGLSQIVDPWHASEVPLQSEGGTEVAWYYRLKGYIMSEKINY